VPGAKARESVASRLRQLGLPSCAPFFPPAFRRRRAALQKTFRPV